MKDAIQLASTSNMPLEVCHLLLNPDKEEHTVAIIKQYLLTPTQKAWLGAEFISVEDMLNGRVEGESQQARVAAIFTEWNSKLGRKMFGASL